MLAISPVPSNANLSAAAVVPTASLVSNATNVSALTYLAATPANADGSVLNQRQVQVESNPRAAILAVPQINAVASSGGLQPAALQNVSREYGYSSPFMAQLIDQASGAALGTALDTPVYRNLLISNDADTIKFLPSSAGVPVAIPPLLKLAQGIAPVISTPQPVAAQPAPVATPAPAVSSPVNFVAPEDYLPAAAYVTPSVALRTTSANDAAPVDNSGLRAVRARQANVAYLQAAQRLESAPAPVAEENYAAAPTGNTAPVEAIQSVA